MPTPNSFPQADGADCAQTMKCDTCPAPATMFISDRGFGSYRCDSCGTACVAERQHSPLLAYAVITRKVAA